MSKPTLDPTYPAYAVADTDSDNEVTRVAAVTGLRSDQNLLEDLLRRIIIRYGKTVTTVGEGATESTTRGYKPSSTDETGTDVALFPGWTAPTATAASTTAATSETATVPEGLVGRDVFPDFNNSFPFLQPGWQKEKTPGGFIMIPPRVTMDRWRAENGD